MRLRFAVAGYTALTIVCATQSALADEADKASDCLVSSVQQAVHDERAHGGWTAYSDIHEKILPRCASEIAAARDQCVSLGSSLNVCNDRINGALTRILERVEKLGYLHFKDAGARPGNARAASVDALLLVQQLNEVEEMCTRDPTLHFPRYYNPELACDAARRFARALTAAGYCQGSGSLDHYWRKGKANKFGSCE